MRDAARAARRAPSASRRVASGTSATGSAGRRRRSARCGPPTSGRRRRRAPPRGCPRGPRARGRARAAPRGRARVRPRAAPATRPRAIVAALEPSPRDAGSGSVKRTPACPRAQPGERAARRGGRRRARRRSPPRPRARSRGRARPRRSRSPGRRSRSCRRADVDRHTAASAIELTSGSTAWRQGTRDGVSGSFRPWPVITHTTRARRGARDARRREGRGRGRLAEEPFLARERTPGVEDLRRRDRHHAPPVRAIASSTPRVNRLADPDRGGDVSARGSPPRRRGARGIPGPASESPSRRRTCSRRRRRGARARPARSPSSSRISNAAVFWPSSRYGLSELTST